MRSILWDTTHLPEMSNSLGQNQHGISVPDRPLPSITGRSARRITGMHFDKEAFRYDVDKIFGFFDLLPPCPHLVLTYTLKFTQPPLLHLLFHDPPLMRTSYLEAPLACATRAGTGSRSG